MHTMIYDHHYHLPPSTLKEQQENDGLHISRHASMHCLEEGADGSVNF